MTGRAGRRRCGGSRPRPQRRRPPRTRPGERAAEPAWHSGPRTRGGRRAGARRLRPRSGAPVSASVAASPAAEAARGRRDRRRSGRLSSPPAAARASPVRPGGRIPPGHRRGVLRIHYDHSSAIKWLPEYGHCLPRQVGRCRRTSNRNSYGPRLGSTRFRTGTGQLTTGWFAGNGTDPATPNQPDEARGSSIRRR